MNPERLTLGFGTDPFVKAIAGDYAAAPLESLAKAHALFEGFGLAIDALAGAAVILGPAIHQTPARAGLSGARIRGRGLKRMCGRFTLTWDEWRRIADVLGIDDEGDATTGYRPRFDIAPTDRHFIVTS